ncbi:MAG: hypothetical protein NTW45_01175 [Rhodocyclales bacterium]|nr:hypothetical protein [Rhodocyclales bacterium]
MKANHRWVKQIAKLVFLLMMGVTMSADAGLFGLGGISWKEEVLLHDGSKIIATRTVERGGRHEIGQEPPIKEQSLSFNMPGTHEKIIWEDKASADVEGANFNLMLLDVVKGTPYVVGTPAGCLSYNKWGRPNPPYVIFKYDGKEWRRVLLQELPTEIKMPNLLQSSPDHEAKKAEGGLVSAKTIKEHHEGYRQPEYKTILREALPKSGGDCEELIRYKGYWIMPNDPVARSMVDRKTK